jgi:hypothetical protein
LLREKTTTAILVQDLGLVQDLLELVKTMQLDVLDSVQQVPWKPMYVPGSATMCLLEHEQMERVFGL